MINYNDIKKKFENLGFIKINRFIDDDNFFELCKELNDQINKKFFLEKKRIKNLGGNLIGNININLGHKGDKIWSYLTKKNINKLISDLTDFKDNEYSVFCGGNLLFAHPNSHNQLFHTDGKKKPRKIIISLCLDNIDKDNGPTELYEKSHIEELPYWKFLFKYFFKKKYQLSLNKGDIFVREAFIWHRGTKNNSLKNRILINFIISEEKNKDLNYESNKEIYFFDNMFESNFFGKIKEFANVRLKVLYFIYKFFRSFV